MTSQGLRLRGGNTTEINFSHYHNIEVKVIGKNVPNPISSFKSLGLSAFVLENVKKSGYTKPTPVQRHVVPIIMDDRDLMACVQAGSGKTAAFLLPIINNLLMYPEDLILDGQQAKPQAIIVLPTKGLAIQIFEQACKSLSDTYIKVGAAYEGTAVENKSKLAMSGWHILVATARRLNDLVNEGHISFESTRFVVLDEVDRIHNMGFLSNMEDMLTHITMVPTGERRTLMFSATFPHEIQRLAAKFLHNHIFIAVGIVEGDYTNVEQVVYQVNRSNKVSMLKKILRSEGTEMTLMFVNTKRQADFFAILLSEANLPTVSIHGHQQHSQREQALRDFKRGAFNILVTTSGATGLDITGVTCVINFDLPKDIDKYVYRIGHTGRLGTRGKAISFYNKQCDSGIAANLVNILKRTGQLVPNWLVNAGRASYKSSAFGGHDD